MTIGLLGGMGPMATAWAHQLILNHAARAGAVGDGDYPEVLVWSRPLPGLDADGLSDPSPASLSTLHQAATWLVDGGADVVAMACNSVAGYHSALSESCVVPVIDPLDATVARVVAGGWNRVAVLSSASLRASGQYRRRFAAHGVELVELTDREQDFVTATITAVMGGAGERQRVGLVQLCDRLGERGADAVVVGCTELSVPAVCPQLLALPVIDSTDALVVAALAADGNLVRGATL